jgi:hypothetical protein
MVFVGFNVLCLGFEVLLVVVGWSLGGGPLDANSWALLVGRWAESRWTLLFCWLFGVGLPLDGEPLDANSWALLVGRWAESRWLLVVGGWPLAESQGLSTSIIDRGLELPFFTG